MKLDLINERFTRLTVVKRVVKKRVYWLCECDCGNFKEVQTSHLRSGATQSCGCLQKERARKSNTKHDGKGTRLYRIWKNLRQRCNNENNPRYKDYGGRGLKVCEEWNDFINFKKWSLENGYDVNLEIDRIENDKGYSGNNCRWTTTLVNNSNRRITVRVEKLTLKEISKKYNVKYTTVKSRYYEFLKKEIKPNIKLLVTSQS